MTTLQRYNWLRRIPPELKQLDEPLPFGHTPPFDETKFVAELSDVLKLPGLKLLLKPLELKEGAKLKEGFEQSAAFFFRVAPFQGEAALLIPKGDFDRLLTEFSEKDLHHHILEEEFKTAFSHFVLLETIVAFQA